MTIQQAIEVIKEATEPVIVGRITRNGYATIETAIRIIEAELRKTKEPPFGEHDSASDLQTRKDGV